MKIYKKNYHPEIDGLRGIAVFSVIFFHLMPQGFFSGGFIGVDIFFVISGFLITGIIYEKMIINSFSYISFIKLRIARLYPALLFLILFVLIIGFLIYNLSSYLIIVKSGKYALLSLSNIYFSRSKGYWDGDSTENPLLHTWSLSVEQQFYLIWPLVIIFLFKLNKQKLFISIIIISLISFFSAQLLSITYPIKNFYYMPTRIFELGVGGAWYIFVKNNLWIHKNISNFYKEMMLFIGLSIIIFCSVTYHGEYKYYPGINTLPVVLASIFCIFGGEAKYLGFILKNKVIVFIGLISYSVYLIHWPLIVFYKYITAEDILSFNASIILFSLFILFGCLMYFFIENKFRRISISFFTKSGLVFWSIFGTCLLLVLYVKYENYMEDRGYSDDYSFSIHLSNGYDVPYYYIDDYIGDTDKNDISLIIVGDSISRQYIHNIDNFLRQHNLKAKFFYSASCLVLKFKSEGAVSDLDSNCLKIQEQFYSYIDTNKGIPIVNFQAWGGRGYDMRNQRINDLLKEAIDITNKTNSKLFFIEMHPRINNFCKNPIDNFIKSIKPLIESIVSNPCENKNMIQFGSDNDYGVNIKIQSAVSRTDNKNIIFIDGIYNTFCDKAYCYANVNNKPLYTDSTHLSKNITYIPFKKIEEKLLGNLEID